MPGGIETALPREALSARRAPSELMSSGVSHLRHFILTDLEATFSSAIWYLA